MIPETVKDPIARELYGQANAVRAALKAQANAVVAMRGLIGSAEGRRAALDSEVIANTMIAYRHLEDASMRLGKVLQALDGGVSVYDKATTVDTPTTPADQQRPDLPDLRGGRGDSTPTY